MPSSRAWQKRSTSFLSAQISGAARSRGCRPGRSGSLWCQNKLTDAEHFGRRGGAAVTSEVTAAFSSLTAFGLNIPSSVFYHILDEMSHRTTSSDRGALRWWHLWISTKWRNAFWKRTSTLTELHHKHSETDGSYWISCMPISSSQNLPGNHDFGIRVSKVTWDDLKWPLNHFVTKFVVVSVTKAAMSLCRH